MRGGGTFYLIKAAKRPRENFGFVKPFEPKNSENLKKVGGFQKVKLKEANKNKALEFREPICILGGAAFYGSPILV